jgi:extradiol dioxygenase family protein
MDPTLHTLICPVAEMGRAAAFYRDVLGLTPGYQSEHWSEFRLGDVRIGLHPCFADTPAPAD